METQLKYKMDLSLIPAFNGRNGFSCEQATSPKVPTTSHRQPSTSYQQPTTNNQQPETKNPDFFAKAGIDVFLVGFDLTESEVSAPEPNNEGDPAGWFFVLEERAGDLRFGADVPKQETGLNGSYTDSDSGDIEVNRWNDLTWGHIADAMGIDTLSELNFIEVDENSLDNKLVSGDPDEPPWGKNAANMGHILFQAHVRVAIHADKMIKNN